ncbi:Ribosomal protein [Parasponia andersonii]|uniref:CL1 n=1 Tax=Parasponia andersonii TaxID=3476 RepID=A0A2P5ARV1_PARAD|nr:Ribosomal protein [Parasponia andersonii]
MAAHRLLSEARRHYLATPSHRLPLPPALRFHRFLCSPPPSESDPNPSAPEPPTKAPRSVPIQPVSYAVKPKDPSPPEEEPPQPTQTPPPQHLWTPRQDARSTWTREDARFIRDAPSITPVSYPSRAAPLPEDKVSVSGENAERPASESEELQREKQQIEAENRMRRRVFRVVEEEKVVAPFPMLIKVEKKERKPVLDLMEAIRQVKASARCNFDETVEAHVKLGIDAKRAGRGVRGNMTLPHGSGKVVRVAFFAEGELADEARAAGADIVGGAELVEEVAGSNKLNVDKCFATNEMILRLGKISRILRERGLWPDRKLGTVTNDVLEAMNKVRQGHTEFKMDKTSIVHMGVGKVSYSEDYLRENIGAFMNALLLAKPQGLKKASKYAGYINSFHICSTMGPGFPISIQSLSKAADHYNKLK